MLSSYDKLKSITLALAGMCQAARLAQQLARFGVTEEMPFISSVHSIYQLDPKDVESVYISPRHLETGLFEVGRLFSKRKRVKTDAEVLRYLGSLIRLADKLSKKPALQQKLQQRLQHVIQQANYFSPTHATVLGNLSDIYLSIFGQMPFRIHVIGQKQYLHNEHVMTKIRVLFLAGVRSVILWRQLGGKQLQFLFQRQRMYRMAVHLLGEAGLLTNS